MPDQARQPDPGTPRHAAALFSLTLRDVAARFAQAGMPRDIRTLQRYCASGMLASTKEMTATGMQYFIEPDSVARAITQLAQMHVLTDEARHAAAGRTSPHSINGDFFATTENDMPRPTAVNLDTVDVRPQAASTPSEPDAPRPAATDLDIFEHPYVRRLQADVEKWQGKYEQQVERTQQVMQKANDSLIELQQANAVANSKTLADFMLRAGRFLKAPFAREEETGADDIEAGVK